MSKVIVYILTLSKKESMGPETINTRINPSLLSFKFFQKNQIKLFCRYQI